MLLTDLTNLNLELKGKVAKNYIILKMGLYDQDNE